MYGVNLNRIKVIKMTTIQVKIGISYLGGHERAYEDVNAVLTIEFSDEGIILRDVKMNPLDEKYIQSLGSSLKFWEDSIRYDFNNHRGDILELVVEELSDEEYDAVKKCIICN